MPKVTSFQMFLGCLVINRVGVKTCISSCENLYRPSYTSRHWIYRHSTSAVNNVCILLFLAKVSGNKYIHFVAMLPAALTSVSPGIDRTYAGWLNSSWLDLNLHGYLVT